MALGFGSLEIARSGLYVNERGLFVAGHNISNVNTPGYVRQQAMISTGNYQNDVRYQLGLGADIQKIRQIRHQFLDNVYRAEVRTLGYWEAREKTFRDIQAILGEPLGDGLQKNMNQFWDSWQELSKDPGSLTVRALVRQRGDTLVQFINHIGSQLDKLQSDLNSEIQIRIQEINSLAESIAGLNLQITHAEVAGDAANDLRDQRNLKIDRLCKLIDCQVDEWQDGQVTITIGGYFIVNKANHEKIKAVPNEPGSLFVAPAIGDDNILLPVNGGILKGLMESRGEVKYTKASPENGSPYDKIDLVFAFNLNDTDAQRNALIDKIDSIVKTYTEKGMQVRLGYVAFDGSGVIPAAFCSDVSDFKTQIGSLVFSSGSPDGDVSAALKDAMGKTIAQDVASGWNNAARQFVLLSEGSVDATNIVETSSLLQKNNFHTLVVSDAANKNQLGILPEFTRDRFITSGLSTADASDDINLDEVVIESMRNSVYGDVRDTGNIIPDLRQRLNLIVSSLTREVNRLHKSGTTLGESAHQGEDFFVAIDPNYPLQMGNIQLNPNLSNLNNIVASYSNSSGDNTIALQISDLRHMSMLGNFSQIQSLDAFYHATLMAVGNGGAEAANISKSQDMLVTSVDNQRQAIMNVSMDEEMANMMKYQFAYGASAKVLNALDEMYDSIINRLGIVGR